MYNAIRYPRHENSIIYRIIFKMNSLLIKGDNCVIGMLNNIYC